MGSKTGFDKFKIELDSLVDSFAKRRPHFRAEAYDEAQLRIDFLNRFWRELGWDVENRAHQPPSLRDVEVEKRVHIDGRKKRADYVFRTDGVPQFVCEAQKATEGLTKKDAYLVQRYAFNLKVYLAVLTNFDSLEVFVVGGRPDESDPFPVAKRWSFLQFNEGAQEIWDLLSREGVAGHSIEMLVRSLRKKPMRGKVGEGRRFLPERVRTVDDAFLEYVERQREDLARNLIAHNPSLIWTDTVLSECIQRILDRILFVRICEDRDIDTGRSLEGIVNEWMQIDTARPALYPRLVAHFNSLDVRFNGTLFRKGHLSEQLNVSNDFLVAMIQDLSREDFPYLFSTLPAEILGSVYEQFIGKVVRTTRTGKVNAEPKPEVRRARGVYYTPKRVVDYIVEHTVGNLIGGKAPSFIEELRVLDPACGAGSFLLRVFERICDEYVSYLQNNESKQRKELCYKDDSGNLHLTPHTKRQILMNNVFGVDIDFRAVEVTMLSLYLKMLEGETRTTLDNNRHLFPKEAFLPDLSANIKCGNSLIGPDFTAGEQLSVEQTAVREKVNAFDWDAEFKTVIQNGKFDAVVGNPPYVLLQGEFRDNAQLRYFREKYRVASYKVDMYHLFTERGIALTRAGGKCAMITPANFLTNKHLANFRRYLLDETAIDHIVVIDGGVFRGVSVENAIFVVKKGTRTTAEWPLIHATNDGSLTKVSSIDIEVSDNDKGALFTGSEGSTKLWDEIYRVSVRLGQIANVNFGKQLRDRSKYPRDVIELKKRTVPAGYRRCYTGRDIERYRVTWSRRACLDRRVAKRGGCWHSSRQNSKNKLITRQIGTHPDFALDSRGFQCLNTIFMVNVHGAYDPYYVLAMLNSKLTKALWRDRYCDRRQTFPKIKGTYLEELPVFASLTPTGAEKKMMAELAELGKVLVNLSREGDNFKTGHARSNHKRRIDSAETRINNLVYLLYRLDDSKIKQIEAMADFLPRVRELESTGAKLAGPNRQQLASPQGTGGCFPKEA